MNLHCTILMNQKAGAFQFRAGPEEMDRTVREVGLDAEVVTTTSAEDLREKVRQLIQAGCNRIGIAGGDGTVHVAVQQVACTNTALGIIPQGTANNFATALRLPMDLPSAIRVLKEGEPRGIDLGRARREFFTESAGVGLFADALALYGKGTNKNVFRGLYALVRIFCSLKAHRLRLLVDGKPHTERAVLCIAANAFRMGAAIPVAPGAKMTDGELDIVIIGDLTRGELIPYYRAFRAQLHRSLPKVTTLRTHEIVIEAAQSLNVHCDDQVIGHTPVSIAAQPGALKVVVDRL